MFSVSSICPQIPHICIPCIIYSITLWYPQFTPSRLRHATQVYYTGMAQSLMYVMPYSHTAAYMPIALPKGTFWSTAVTLCYHHISAFRLCHNGNALCILSHIHTHICIPYSVTLWYPHISPSRLHHGTSYLTLIWLILAYTPHPTPT